MSSVTVRGASLPLESVAASSEVRQNMVQEALYPGLGNRGPGFCPVPIVRGVVWRGMSSSQVPEITPAHLSSRPTNFGAGKHLFAPHGFHYPSTIQQDPYGSAYARWHVPFPGRVDPASFGHPERLPQSVRGVPAASTPTYPGRNVPPAIRPRQPLPLPVNLNLKQSLETGATQSCGKVRDAKQPKSIHTSQLPPHFTKGALIQLSNGQLRKVEDITTEDFVSSAEKCPAFRLDPSTVVRIQERPNGSVLLTLSYGEQKTIELESTQEHPYFVYGQGWASCSPERTMRCFGLQCHPLRVGDVCISLSPR